MYINLHTAEAVRDNDAYEYAKMNLDYLDGKDKEMFVEWFYSGNWLYRTQEQIDEERELGGIGAYFIDLMEKNGGKFE